MLWTIDRVVECTVDTLKERVSGKFINRIGGHTTDLKLRRELCSGLKARATLFGLWFGGDSRFLRCFYR